ncbi:hypothetical protein ANI02nite_18770 [Acetobacter nitrogenifigens DSM 23921 = NBRC 105050]|uniref:Uncharacterized protein n=1 Tax=Acetobacter nitrogenifigens DSM 23921 = NBRC 105050 TaxID=1120919 RepID=A0A511XAL0_9PROT|nr:hypothetical protein ANI02nite_18770 [Acetobacter nitrogenifigens DSM 23921 = NBRC 105050]
MSAYQRLEAFPYAALRENLLEARRVETRHGFGEKLTQPLPNIGYQALEPVKAGREFRAVLVSL